MTISEYMISNSETQAGFAQKLGVSKSTVWRYMRGRVPVAAIMRRIVTLTSGAVRPEDFYR